VRLFRPLFILAWCAESIAEVPEQHAPAI
jgi:hypothetical protein